MNRVKHSRYAEKENETKILFRKNISSKSGILKEKGDFCMLAFMDAEYNSDRDYKEKRADRSLIEVALIITDDKAMNVVDSYHSYVVPQLHDGKLYKRISKMTGIRQEDVDSGISFAKSIEDMYSQKIYAGCSWLLTVRGMRIQFSCSEKNISNFSGIFFI